MLKVFLTCNTQHLTVQGGVEVWGKVELHFPDLKYNVPNVLTRIVLLS